MSQFIHVHGSCSPSPGKGAYGFIIYSEGEEIKKDQGIVSNYTTANIAEYNSIIKALEAVKELGFNSAKIFSSNKLVVGQLNGLKNVSTHQLKNLHKSALKLMEEFEFVDLGYIPREKNKAVKLVKSFLNPSSSTRKDRAKELAQNVFLKTKNGYIYFKDDGYYEINLKKLSCTCFDNQVNGYVCKHILAAQLLEKRVEKLIK